MTLNARQRWVLAAGAVILLALVGLGLRPVGETHTYVSQSGAQVQPDPDGLAVTDTGVVSWEASGSCSVLFGDQSLSGSDTPAGSYVARSDDCASSEATRPWLLLAMAVVAFVTAVAMAWCASPRVVADAPEP